jgi:hypothetical protein
MPAKGSAMWTVCAMKWFGSHCRAAMRLLSLSLSSHPSPPSFPFPPSKQTYAHPTHIDSQDVVSCAKRKFLSTHRCMQPMPDMLHPICKHIQSKLRCADVTLLRMLDGFPAIPEATLTVLRALSPSMRGLFACKAKCGGKRAESECSQQHPCALSCGACTLSSLKATKEWPDAQIRTTHANKCPTPCHRPLLCGHECESGGCHSQDECPSCTKACSVSCIHSKCTNKCKEPCSLCVEACTWQCPIPHASGVVHACPMRCGSPCLRLPCDERCEKMLRCGHRCPGLCGEPCLSAQSCVECYQGKATHSSQEQAHMEQVVDMLLV